MNLSFNLAFRQTTIPIGMKIHYFNAKSKFEQVDVTNTEPANKIPQLKPNFRNMFQTLASARSGCGSCSGAR